MSGTWRTGRKVGRTIYAQQGDAPSDTDPLIGVMDTPELAAEAVAAVSGKRGVAREALLALAAEIEALNDWPKLESISDETAEYARGTTTGIAQMARRRAQDHPGAPSTTSPAQEDPDLTLVGLSPAQAYEAGVKAERERCTRLAEEHGATEHSVDPEARYGSDPDALAWARGHVERLAGKYRRFEAKCLTEGRGEMAIQWRKFANLLEMELTGGQGCVIAPFDARREHLPTESWGGGDG